MKIYTSDGVHKATTPELRKLLLVLYKAIPTQTEPHVFMFNRLYENENLKMMLTHHIPSKKYSYSIPLSNSLSIKTFVPIVVFENNMQIWMFTKTEYDCN